MPSLSRRHFLSALAAGSLAGCLGTTDGDTPVATTRPETTATGLRIDTLDVEGSTGETVPVQPQTVTLLDFFGTWCAPCEPQMDHLRTVRAEFPDVHMLAITWESDAETVRSFWQEHEGTWPVALDPELRTGEEYNVTRIPTLVVFDAAGEEVWRHVGLAAADSIAEQLETARARS
jgi:thiol-disulfide isomerase/thioredoxin